MTGVDAPEVIIRHGESLSNIVRINVLWESCVVLAVESTEQRNSLEPQRRQAVVVQPLARSTEVVSIVQVVRNGVSFDDAMDTWGRVIERSRSYHTSINERTIIGVSDSTFSANVAGLVAGIIAPNWALTES